MSVLRATAIGLVVTVILLATQQPARCQETGPVVSLLEPARFSGSPGSTQFSSLNTPSADGSSVAPTAAKVVPAMALEADLLTVRVATAQARLNLSPDSGQVIYGHGAVVACAPTCVRCGGTGECDALFTAPGGVIWSTCANGCGNGCVGKGGCRTNRHCRGGSCGGDCQDWTCLDLCSRQGFWLRADALMWWAKEDRIPTLVTSSPLGTPIGDVGVLGLPTTSEIFNGPLFDDLRIGGRLRFGWWGGDCKRGLEGSLWGIENERNEVSWSSAGAPAYARPFFNADPLVIAPDAELVSFDATLDGTVTVNSSSEILGGDLGLRCNLMCCSDFCGLGSTRVDLLAGYRYFKVREGIRITENLESIALSGPAALGTRIDLFDDFRTRNEFHGVSFGMVAASQHGRWTAEVSPRVAFGNIARQVTINGQNTVTVPGLDPINRSGGLLAQPTNVGQYDDDEFAVLPEVRADLGFSLNCKTKLLLGYTFVYLGDIVRPGDIIDPTVNGLQLDPTLPLVGPERPQFDWNDSNMWLMGLNLGLEYCF